MKHKYLMTIYNFFTGNHQFVIEANNKKQATEIGTIYVKQNPPFCYDGNFDYNSVKCIKKLQAKKELR